MTEQFAFDQIGIQCDWGDGNVRSIGAATVPVNRGGDQFFAGACFAGDQHRQIAVGDQGDLPEDLLHRWRRADQDRRIDVHWLSRGGSRSTRRFLECRSAGAQSVFEFEWFGQVVGCSVFDCCDSGFQVTKGGDDDDRSVVS